jgi:hypothetical protein
VLYFGSVAEGEGIAGRAGIAIGTTTMLGCMGIAFLTRSFSYGGLYHYPANGIVNTPVQETIRNMLNDISPGIIVITPALAEPLGVDPVDLHRVKDFLKLVWSAAEIGVAKAAPAAFLRWTNGKPEVNLGAPDGAKSRVAPEAFRNMPHPSGRELLGGAVYYGGRMVAKDPVRPARVNA